MVPASPDLNDIPQEATIGRPILFVVSGPSGGGKGTAMRHILTQFPQITKIATYTTRPVRAGEKPGEDYSYISREEFADLESSGHIYESVSTYGDHRYGSPRVLLEPMPKEPLLVELELEGVLRLKQSSQRTVVSLFIYPPSIDILIDRISKRNPESNISARIEKAREQIRYALAYDYVLVNKDLEQFCEDLRCVVGAELVKATGMNTALRDSLTKEVG